MRIFLLFPAAILVTISLFVAMSYLAGLNRVMPKPTDKNIILDMRRLKVESELQTRKFEKTPPPEFDMNQAEIPPMPVTPMNQTVAKVKPDLAMEQPDIKMDMNIQSKVDLSNLRPQMDMAQMDMGIQENLVPKFRVNPQYPPRALSRRVEGYVVAEFIVGPDGRVKPGSFKIIDSNPKNYFEEAVERALTRWRFNPMMQQGSPVSFRARQRLEFALK